MVRARYITIVTLGAQMGKFVIRNHDVVPSLNWYR